MKWSKWFTRKLPEIKKQPKLPEAGETWFIPEKSPWPSDIYMVLIRDAKEGWVRYSFGRSVSSSDERMELDRFMNIYEHLDYGSKC